MWGDAAVYVDPDDPEALHAALAALARSDARRRRMAARALQRARRFGADRMTDAYRGAYAELVGRLSTGWPVAGSHSGAAPESGERSPSPDAGSPGGGA